MSEDITILENNIIQNNKMQGAVSINPYTSSKMILYPDNDTYVMDNNKYYSYYTASTLKTGNYNNDNFKSFISFNDSLSKVPYSVIKNILNIKIKFYSVGNFTGTVSLFSLDTKFKEDSINWVKHPEKNELIKTINPKDEQILEFEVTDHVKAMLQQNKVLRGFTFESSNFLNVYSSNNVNSKIKPVIEIEYVDDSLLLSSTAILAEANLSPVVYKDAECIIKTALPVIEGEVLYSQNVLSGNTSVLFVSQKDAECKWVIPTLTDIDGEILFNQESVKGEVGLASLLEQDGEMILNKVDNSEINAEAKIGFTKLLIKNGEARFAFEKSKDAECDIIPVSNITKDAELRLVVTDETIKESELLMLFQSDTKQDAEMSLLFNSKTDKDAELRLVVTDETIKDAECFVSFTNKTEKDAELRLVVTDESTKEAEVLFSKEASIEIKSEMYLLFEDKIEKEAEVLFVKTVEEIKEAEALFLSTNNLLEKDAELRLVVTDETIKDVECNIKFVSTLFIDAECNITFEISKEAETLFLSTNNLLIKDVECNMLFANYLVKECECVLTNTRENEAHGAVNINPYISSKLRIYTDNDTFVTNTNEELSFYNFATLKYDMSGTNKYMTFISFYDLMNIDEKLIRYILNSSLVLTSLNKFNGTIKIYEIDRQFNEKNITWLNHPNKTDLVTEYTVSSASKIKIPLGDFAKKVAQCELLHNGFIIESDSPLNIASSNSAIESNRPYIEVEYFDVSRNIVSNAIEAECKLTPIIVKEGEMILKLPFPIIDGEVLYSQNVLKAEVNYLCTSVKEAECKWKMVGSKVIEGEVLFSQDRLNAECSIILSEVKEAECKLSPVIYKDAECIYRHMVSKDAELSLSIPWVSEIEGEVLFSQDRLNAECSITPVVQKEAECDILLLTEKKAEMLLMFNEEIIKQSEALVLFGKSQDVECDILLQTSIECECSLTFDSYIYYNGEMIFESTNNEAKKDAEVSIRFRNSKDAELVLSPVIYKDAELVLVVSDNSEKEAEINIAFKSEFDGECLIQINNAKEEKDAEALLATMKVKEAECSLIFLDSRARNAYCSILFSTEHEAELRLVVSEKIEIDAECILKSVETYSYLTINRI